MNYNMIEVKNLTKRYGNNVAVDNVSFTVNEGEILGFLGPNGAGKSTTMNILTGYISSTEGQAFINGVNILEDALEAKKYIGYLPEQPPLYLDMTVKDYLNFVYDLKKCSLPRKTHLYEICDIVKITDVYNRIIKNLSKGYRQRVGLAQALIGNPKILILDEPTVGLDPKQIIEIRTLIKRLGKSHTIILSSHILPEIQAVCDKIIVINKGTIVANDTSEQLSSNITGNQNITVAIDGPSTEVKKLIEAINGVESVIINRNYDKNVTEYSVRTINGTDIRKELFKRLSERSYPIMMLKSSELTLEDIFIKLTASDYIEPNLTQH